MTTPSNPSPVLAMPAPESLHAPGSSSFFFVPRPECRFVVEMQSEDGYRWWSGSMPEFDVDGYIDAAQAGGAMLSDIDHAGACVGSCSEPL